MIALSTIRAPSGANIRLLALVLLSDVLPEPARRKEDREDRRNRHGNMSLKYGETYDDNMMIIPFP
jgi:hypothetical protein